MNPKQIVTPKAFYVGERDRFYSDWTISFWRELFQNSVDAGAKTIRISLKEEAGKGSFGRDATQPRVIRVVFDDDGSGMTKEVLDRVYFAPGETTKKDGNSTGGYGRARLMTCFSQVRYGIATQDRIVEGDGPEYTNMSVDEAISAARAHLDAARDGLAKASSESVSDAWRRKVSALEEVVAELDEKWAYHKGCRIEVDINPNEYPDSKWRNPSLAQLSQRLDEYLSQSQLPCKVIVNGEERRDSARRGPARRKLVAELETSKVPPQWLAGPGGSPIEGEAGGISTVAFATVHLSQSDKARHKGSVIVRVNGAAMFVKSTSAGQQIIVEIDQRLSRDVMTSNRDGLRDPYDTVLQDYLEKLATDASKALEDESDRRFTMVRGGKGLKVFRPVEAEIEYGKADRVSAFAGAEPAPIRTAKGSVRFVSKEVYIETGIGGVPSKVMEAFLEKVRIDGAASTFLGEFHDQEAASRIETDMQLGSESALGRMSEDLLHFITTTLRLRMAQAESKRRDEMSALSDLNDVPIQRDGLEPQDPNLSAADKKKLRRNLTNSIWRNNPENFKPSEGKGMQPRRLLAAWTVAVDAALRKYMELYPSSGETEWAAGWYFGQSKWEYVPHKQAYGLVRTNAQHQMRKDVHMFLLNPLSDDLNKLRYTPTKSKDRDSLITLALHEVAHVMTDRHDSAFAQAFTRLVDAFDTEERRKVHQEILMAVQAAKHAFNEGRTRVQAMDDEEGTRPSEKLLGMNAEYPAYGEAVTRDEDGTTVVDCDKINEIDAERSLGQENDGELAP